MVKQRLVMRKNIFQKGKLSYNILFKISLMLCLVPGKSMCPTCYSNIFVARQNENDEEKGDVFVNPMELTEKLDSAFNILELSPSTAKIRKLSSGKRNLAISSKAYKVSEEVKKKLQLCFGEGDKSCQNYKKVGDRTRNITGIRKKKKVLGFVIILQKT
ncbi:hypothetical protein PR048_004421 [Dryococelus australis]|uniref:Uncharacterized protein n=1 Tax=Dryococelus australis TaxID=614101 RepID=A0ABQ9I5E7_9NEOP|nr:hypothetical protein PR048_004421 [Dryococelus australis]